jgi:L-idonate 5-dehydrogenase
MAEPLAVVLHAMGRGGDLLGRRVLVTGCGPIGTLAILSARRAGAAEIVATDLSDYTLGLAAGAGADSTVNVATEPDGLAGYRADKGYFDVLFECSGAGPALVAGIEVLRPRGIVVQLGIGGDMSLPMTTITAKEIDLRGSFRFHDEFAVGVEMMRRGLMDVRPLISQTLEPARAEDGFRLASDRSQTMQVQIAFS